MNKTHYKNWEYKITNGFTGLILTVFLLLAFVALTYWFYVTRNSAIVIGKILVIFAFFIFILVLYRTMFYKILISKDGFLYQTTPFNKKYYNYYEISEAWISTGRQPNGILTNYCNFKTMNGNVLRFSFLGAHTIAVDYLIEQAKKTKPLDNNSFNDNDLEYIISRKTQNTQSMAAIFFFLTLVLLQAFLFFGRGDAIIPYIFSIALACVVFASSISYFLFYKIKIQKEGFFFRTNFWNGQYFSYSDVIDYKIIEKRIKVGTVRGSREIKHLYYFMFTDVMNKEHKILYDKASFEREINILVYRIRQAQCKDNEM